MTTFSGGAQAFTSAVNFLNSVGQTDVTNMIDKITYVSPGAVGSLYDNGHTIALLGQGVVDVAATSATALGTIPFQVAAGCGHDFACIRRAFAELMKSRRGDACSEPAEVFQADATRFGRMFQEAPERGDRFYSMEMYLLQFRIPASFVPSVSLKITYFPP